MFKRFTHLLRVRPLRGRRRDGAEAAVHALLIAWALQERLADDLRRALATERTGAVRSWRVCQMRRDTVRQKVLGRWTRARLRACLPRLRCFLCGSPCQRTQQETHLRNWLHRRTRLSGQRMAA